MVITVAVVHTEETPCMKKLASTWIFWYLSRNSSWCLVVCWLFPSKFGTFLHDYICTCRVANRLDLDQTRRFVGPDLGPNCLHSLSADGNSRKRDPENLIILFVYQVQMTEFHGSCKSIGTEIYRDVTVIRSLWNGRYFFLRLYGTPMYKMRLKAPNHKHKQLNCPINN